MLILEKVTNYLGLVRFSHTVFALPFAFMSAFVAADGVPSWSVMGWILVCMVTARTCAMTFNRIVDRHIDQKNPRTQDRHIPAGKVTLSEAYGILLLSTALFFYGAWQLNPLALALSPIALAIICGYSFFKRFTAYCHFILGLALAIAPIGAWIAVTGQFEYPPLLLALGVLLWVAGFDIIYALLDEKFDQEMGIHSLVVAYGVKRSLQFSFILHILSIVSILLFGFIADLGLYYFIGVIAFLSLVVCEHSLVKPNDIKGINMAFFNVNGTISIGLFLFTLVDILL